MNSITIKGARQHNLKNIDVEIPKDAMVVITGVSGSGKSSLAFDTIYAEGQRRYVESLSAYARQFLGVMDKPDVDSIDGLSPSISIDQKTVSHNPRSTVGTITEIYDYLRLLFARIGHPHCPKCGQEITRMSVDEITDRIIENMREATAVDPLKPHVFRVMSPVVRQRKGEFHDLFTNLQAKGYIYVRVDGRMMNASDDINLIKTNKHSIEAVIDTISLQYKEVTDDVSRANMRSRISVAVEQSTNLSDGLVLLSSEVEDHLFSEQFSCPTCNISLPEIEPRMFSFNSPLGACETCKGIGTVQKVDPDLVLNDKLTINEGGILPFAKFFFHDTWYVRLLKTVFDQEGIDMNERIGKMSEEMKKTILYGTDKKYRVTGTNRMGRQTAIFEPYDGVVKELERRYYGTGSEMGNWELQKFLREELCESCRGKKLKPEVLSITINNKNIADVSNYGVGLLKSFLTAVVQPTLAPSETMVANPIIKEIGVRLSFLENVGLGYLTIGRVAKTLSGGELQRIRLASQIGTGLTGVLYVLDEPSIGLHPRDVSALVSSLKNLQKLGNTLIIVEHDQETIESADYIVELGPMAGRHGGAIITQGTVEQIKQDEKSLTGAYLSGRESIRVDVQPLVTTRGNLILRGAKEHNLKNIDITFPLGNLIAVTGVSGSGKSTLIGDTLYPALRYHIDGHYHEHMGDFHRLEGFQYLERVYLVDQAPIGRTPRSNPATYVGIFDEIRDIYAMTQEAKVRGFQKGRFSFNVKGGRCEKCQGAGVNKIEMQFLPDVYVTCDVCEGKRYNRETLEVTYKGKTIYDVLTMTVDEAVEFFATHHRIHAKLKVLQEIGLGYIQLGQPAPTFSGGEAQRIKLADELAHKGTGKTLYILDEPTTGLHFYDIQKLLHALHQLVALGNTVIVIEHNMDIIKNCQYVVDLGPEGGDQGGDVVYQGPVEGLRLCELSHTGRYVRG